MRLRLSKPGLVTGILNKQIDKVNDKAVASVYSADGAYHKQAPLVVLGGNTRFVYAPPSIDSENFLLYPDDPNRDAFVSFGIAKLGNVSVQNDYESGDYEPSLQDIIVNNENNTFVLSKQAGLVLSTKATGKNIKLQLSSESRVQISRNGVSNDSVLVANASMGFLTTQATQLTTLKAILGITLETLATTYPIAQMQQVFSAQKVALDLISFNNPSLNMVSSSLTIPSEN